MGTQMRAVFLIGMLMLSFVPPVLAQGTVAPAAPGPSMNAPSAPGVGAPSGPGSRPGQWFRFRRGAGHGRRGFGSHRFGHRRFGAWGWVRGLFLLLSLLLLVGLLLLIWRLLNARFLWDRLGHRQDHRQDPAAAILRERYARGEISEDEYRKRLSDLG
jgi:uncharacterized membrane protein